MGFAGQISLSCKHQKYWACKCVFCPTYYGSPITSIYGKVKKTPKYKLSKHLKIWLGQQLLIQFFMIPCIVGNSVTPIWPASSFWKYSRPGPEDHMQYSGKWSTLCLWQYITSITTVELQARGENNGSVHITGTDQLLSKDFRHALRSPNFNTALIKFFIEEWKGNKCAPVTKQKTIFVVYEEQCLQYTTRNIETP
jgi:hypothetical protein